MGLSPENHAGILFLGTPSVYYALFPKQENLLYLLQKSKKKNT